MATNGGGTTKAKLALVLQMVRTRVFLLGVYNLIPPANGISQKKIAIPIMCASSDSAVAAVRKAR
jgi:hypothetical protein